MKVFFVRGADGVVKLNDITAYVKKIRTASEPKRYYGEEIPADQDGWVMVVSEADRELLVEVIELNGGVVLPYC